MSSCALLLCLPLSLGTAPAPAGPCACRALALPSRQPLGASPPAPAPLTPPPSLPLQGCEAILALCTPESVVAQCFNPGPAPNVLWTYEVKQDVDALCNATGLPVCANCTVGKPPVGGWAACPNPTAVLTQLCYSECGWVGAV